MRLRLAPHAAGLLHVGGARIALLNWLLARRHGGRVVLRIDDLDARATGERVEAVQHDLAWLGLDWNDVVRQSERLDPYAAAAERLRAAGRLYPCFESEEELNAKREQRQRRGQAAIYDRAMLKLTPQQRADAEAGGKRPYWRFLLSGVAAEWGDMVLGKQSVKLSAVSDPVLVLADGTPAPAFAAVVDDVELGLTHVVRPADQLGATGIELDVRAALGARVAGGAIRFAHVPMAGKGGPTLRSLRADGVEPAALAGLLAALGTGRAPRAGMPAALVPGFDLSQIGREAPPFDPAALLALNRTVLAETPFEAVQDRLPEGATPAFWTAIRDHVELLREARGWWDVLGDGFVPPVVADAAGLRRALATMPAGAWSQAAWAAWSTGLDAPDTVRQALIGEEPGPSLDVLLPLIGPARVAQRLRLAAAGG